MLMKKLGIKTALATIRTVYTALLISTGQPVRKFLSVALRSSFRSVSNMEWKEWDTIILIMI